MRSLWTFFRQILGRGARANSTGVFHTRGPSIPKYIRRYQVAITPNPSAITRTKRSPLLSHLMTGLPKLVASVLAPKTRLKRRIRMRSSLIAAVLPALLFCNVAIAQGLPAPIPSLSPTSPLGLGTGSTVSPTIPLGATELASPGISPAPTGVTGTIAMPGSTTSCSTAGTSPSTMSGSTSTYDGGGMAVGGATPAAAATSGMSTSGICGSSSGSAAVSSTATSTSPTTTGGVAQTGIPLGSTEIGNLGVSSAASVPTIGVSPITGSVASGVAPTAPSVSSPP